MIERFLKLTNYVSQMLLTLNYHAVPEMLSAHELRCLQDIYSLLKPFEILTRELSTEISVMSSKVIPIISGTRNEVLKQDPDIVIAMYLKIKLVEELDYRCGSYEQTPLLPICTLLDPRFKDMHFQNPLANSKAQEKIVQMMDSDNIVVNLALSTAESEESGNSDEPCDLWGLHKTLEQQRNDRSSFINTSREELSLYLKQNILKLDENPLTEWENTKSVYPKLFKLAMKYLLIPATSVPSERLFSKAGDTISKTRNRLIGSRLSKLLFLHSVDKSLWNL